MHKESCMMLYIFLGFFLKSLIPASPKTDTKGEKRRNGFLKYHKTIFYIFLMLIETSSQSFQKQKQNPTKITRRREKRHRINLSPEQNMCLEVPGTSVSGRGAEFSGHEYPFHPGFPVSFWSSDNTNLRNQGSGGNHCRDSQGTTAQDFATVL